MPVEMFHDMQSLTSVDLSVNNIKNLADNLILSPALERFVSDPFMYEGIKVK